VTYEKLRLTYQCPEKLAQRLYAELEEARAQLEKMHAAIAAGQAMHVLEQSLRARAEKKLAGMAPRRAIRDWKENS